MRANRIAFGQPIRFRDSEDETESDNTDQPVTLQALHQVVNSALSAQEKKLLKKLGRQENTNSGFDLDRLDEIVEKLLTNDAPTQSSGPDGDKADEGMPHGVKAQLDKMQKRLEAAEKQHQDLQKQIADKDRQVIEQRRSHALERLLTEKRAINPSQAAKLIFPDIVEDEDIGDAVPVKTQTGEDVVPLKDFVEMFSEENPHLFQSDKAGRSGSGASGGSAARGKPDLKAEDLRSPKDGGKSWDDYEKNRESIHAAVEKQVRG